MDPGTAILMAALMILLNGGVLGLVQRELPMDLRPSAISWRIATLLHAAGCVLLALQTEASKIYVLPLANGLLLLGLAGYWRALRQFYGLGEHYGLLWPVALGVIVIYWFVAVHESFPLRVAAVSLAWFWLLLGCIRTLYSTGDRRGSASRDVLAGMFAVAAVFMMLRALYFLSASGSPSSLLDQRHWLNMVTPMVAAVIPVIGTTNFLLMCSQRLTRRWESAASTDYLTGLANRRTVVSKGDALIANAAASGADAALMVVDIDRFKQVNDMAMLSATVPFNTSPGNYSRAAPVSAVPVASAARNSSACWPMWGPRRRCRSPNSCDRPSRSHLCRSRAPQSPCL